MAASMLMQVDDRPVEITNPDKVLFPRSGVTKGDLARYYQRVGPTMLAHLRDRALTTVRYPSGIESKGFFQKDAPAHFPEWIRRGEVPKKGGVVHHVVVADVATMVFLAQHNLVTPHVALASIDDLRRPDRFVVDLDPAADGSFDVVRETALALKAMLERAGLVPFAQVTGSKGIHVVAPLDGRSDWADSQRFAQVLTSILLRDRPDQLTDEFHIAQRNGRLYLDLGRNGHSATMVAPYGVRAREGAPVATPVTWDEVADPALRPDGWNIRTVFDLLDLRPDPWAAMAAAARPLPT